MYLELADNGQYYMNDGSHSYMRDNNSTMLAAEQEAIMLAQNPQAHETMLAQNNTNEAYLFVPMPGGGQYVREDLFDDLNELEYAAVMDQLDAYQPLDDDYLAGKGRQRREARRAARRAAKKERIETRARVGGGIGGILTKATGLFGAIKGGESLPAPRQERRPAGGPPPGGFEEKKNLTPYIIGGVLLLVVGGVIIAAQGKKKRPRTAQA